jgi:hypothetical protein
MSGDTSWDNVGILGMCTDGHPGPLRAHFSGAYVFFVVLSSFWGLGAGEGGGGLGGGEASASGFVLGISNQSQVLMCVESLSRACFSVSEFLA